MGVGSGCPQLNALNTLSGGGTWIGDSGAYQLDWTDMATAKTATKKQRIAKQGDMGSIRMGEWSSREMRRAKRSVGANKGRGGRRIVKPPAEGWSGGDPGKNGSK